MIEEEWIHCQSCGGSLIGDPPGSPVTEPMTDTGKPTAEARLQELKNLFDKGLITTEEYGRKRAEILNDL